MPSSFLLPCLMRVHLLLSYLPVWSCSQRVHRSRLEVDEDSTWNVLLRGGLIVIDLEIKIGRNRSREILDPTLCSG